MSLEIKFPHSLQFAHVPTPIQPLRRWSAYLGGPELWIKRDDLTGLGMTGNKVRKLEFIAADALQKDAQILITCGGLQSNHARTTAILAAQLGLKSHLVLRGDAQSALQGNLLIDRLVGAEIDFVTAEEYSTQANEIMAEIARTYQERGKIAYVIPEGGSIGLGALGYAKAFIEVLQQLESMQIEIDAILCATGSGGTQAGLILGKNLTNWPGRIIGINVCDNRQYFLGRISQILDEAENILGRPHLESRDAMEILDGYVGLGYGKSKKEELEILIKFAKAEGIFLEPVYTGKAMYGLVDQIRQGNFERSQKILFLHSGGVFGMLPYSRKIAALLDLV